MTHDEFDYQAQEVATKRRRWLPFLLSQAVGAPRRFAIGFLFRRYFASAEPFRTNSTSFRSSSCFSMASSMQKGHMPSSRSVLCFSLMLNGQVYPFLLATLHHGWNPSTSQVEHLQASCLTRTKKHTLEERMLFALFLSSQRW